MIERDDDSDNDILPPGSHSQATKGPPNSDINKDTLDQSLARKKFGSAPGLDGSDADFSNSLLRKQSRRPSSRYPPPTARRTFETSEFSILPRGYSIDQCTNASEDETPLERLRRLRFEVDQLEEELEQQKQSTGPTNQPDDEAQEAAVTPSLKGKSKAVPTPTELLVELQHIRDQLSKLSVSAPSSDGLFMTATQLRAREAYAKSLLQQLTERGLTSNEKSYEKPLKTSSNTDSKPTTPAQLDSRLSALEDLLGSCSLLQSSSNGDISLPPPLLVTINKLEHQLSLLTQPRHLDTISRRVKVIVTDLERVHEARRKLTDHRPLAIALASGITVVTQNQTSSSQSSSVPNVNTTLNSVPGVINTNDPSQPNLPPDALHKLERLYNLLPRIDPLLPLVPHLLSRLRSLAQLHTNADQFRQRLDHSTAKLRNISSRSTQVSELLNLIENSFESNEKIIKQNLGLVEDRIEKVLESIDQLKAS